MRATEILSCFNLECDPTTDDKFSLNCIDIENAKHLRTLGLKEKRLRRGGQDLLF